MPYSVSPRRKLSTVGLKPSWNLSTRMPTRFAARKCPSSCTNTSTPSTNANDKTVINPDPSDLQFYPARHLESTLARPVVHRSHLRQRRHLRRTMRVHGPFDDEGNRRETDASVEEPPDRHFIRRVQHDRQTPL